MRKFSLLLVVFLMISLFIGPAGFSSRDIILNIRLPRVLMAVLVGASLSISGLSLQTIFKNALLEPYLLGISSGGALFVFLSSLISLYFPFKAPIFSIFGSLFAISLVLGVSRSREYNPYALLLSGIAISLLFSGILAFLIYILPAERIQIFFYLFGSLSKSSWETVIVVSVIFFISFIYFVLRSRELDIILLEKEEAYSLGVIPERINLEVIMFSSLLASICVAFTGIIGFVGLMIPHISRILKGEKHREIVPLSGVLGGMLLLICDDISRGVLDGVEIPVGIITSLLGVPFFLYLLLKRQRI